MAALPYTNGRNGNGITDAAELLAYLARCPLAFYDVPFMDSYLPLLAAEPLQRAVLECFDLHAAAPATLLQLRLTHGPMQRNLAPLARADLEAALLLGAPLAGTGVWRVCAVRSQISAAAASAAGRFHTLCYGCAANESVGEAADPSCLFAVPHVKARTPGEPPNWSSENVHFICCAVAQAMRDEDPSMPGVTERGRAAAERAQQLKQRRQRDGGAGGAGGSGAAARAARGERRGAGA
jgi:hypothetical protein